MPEPDRLTERERQVVISTAMGRTHDQTAEALDITKQTVKNHMGTACAKYGAHNAHELIWRLGWFNPDVQPVTDDLRTAVDVWVGYWLSREATARDQARDDAAISLMVRQLQAMVRHA